MQSFASVIPAEIEDKFFPIAIITLIVLILFGILSFINLSVAHSNHLRRIKESSNSLRVFIIDSKNDTVRFFNRAHLQKKKTSTITEFYNQFPANERPRLIEWIGKLLEGAPDTPQYLEINVLINYNKKSFFSLLQVEKVDREKGLIYLESYLLRYMYAQKTNSNLVKKFSSHEKFSKVLSSSIGVKGYSFAISFYNKRTRDDDISHLVFAQIENVLVPYISSSRLMLEHGENHIIITDLKLTNRTNVVVFVNTLKNEINRLLTISARQDQIGFAFAVTENKYFVNAVDNLIETLVSLSEVAIDDDKDILFFEEGKKIKADNDSQHYRTEVERIIQDRRLKYTYQPIYHATRGRMFGYLSNVEPLDSFFDSIGELKSYAIRTEDDKELFATISRNAITRFIQEKDGVTLRLFYPISFNEVGYVNRTFSHISSIKEGNIVLVLNEDDLLSLAKDTMESIIPTIKTFKSKGYEVALLLNNNETALPNLIYEVFDFYLISVKSHISAKKSQGRQLPSFQALIEKILRYSKPIIAIDIPTWDLVEYVMKLGLELVSSDAIALPDENVLPLSKKSILKIKNMN